MKKILFNPFLYLLIFFLSSLIFWSCSKSNESAPQNSFSLTYNGNTYKAVNDSAVLISLGTNFVVANFSTGYFWRVYMSLASFNVGSYNFGSGSSISYVNYQGNPTPDATSGTINITANSNNRMSGNFTATIADHLGTIYVTSGNFTDMPISY